MKIKENILKGLFIIIVVGVVFLDMNNYIKPNITFYILSFMFLISAFLMLVKKTYFLSNLISNNTSNPQRLGTISGVLCLIIGILLFILALFNL